jgi:hypothetical protein
VKERVRSGEGGNEFINEKNELECFKDKGFIN